MLSVISLPPSQSPSLRCPVPACSSKQSHRLLSSLSAAPDTSSASRLLRKFVASSSKSTALQALSFLISHSSPFSLHLYQSLSECPWFQWNSKLTASLISFLEEHHRPLDALTLISQSSSILRSPRDLVFFYCDLIDAFSDRRLKFSALRTYAMLKEIPFSGRRPYETMVRGLCLMGMPADAEKFLHEMRLSGFTPSPFEFRLLFQAYGRSAAFGDMTRVLELMQENGISLDTICANIVLSCYGDAGKFSEMVSWIHKMRESDIEFSIRTYNSVLNSSPTLITLTNDVRFLPLSIDALLRKMEDESGYLDEPLLLGELTKLPLLDAIVEWSDSEVKLDLHGLHVTTAYVILLQWMEVVGSRLARGMKAPLEFSIICGSGKHSRMRGESPVKKLVSVMMFQLKSPLKIDRKNIGKFVAKGKPVRDWLCRGVF
ncbi:Pentatricopeptide repeat-containing protein [Platanthera zijinensis]|uniref:Pentatricopeptide repeat-containing protein n=1 Tax=Platanthera zijinensis TaxID=2320716 RepID=A0AAP0BBU0_9ASPA